MLRVLDWYCGAGLVAQGLRAVGVEVVGVDIEPQPNYPGPFIQYDCLRLDDRFLSMFDAHWASPPCLRDTVMKHAPGAKGESHPELIPQTRARLIRTGKPYALENVPGAALINPVVLCGSMFGLGVDDFGVRHHLQRHRLFETNWGLTAPSACMHRQPVIGVYGGHARRRAASAGGRGTRDPWERGHNYAMSVAMGIEPFTRTCEEISQGIPPIYAQYVAEQLLVHLERQRLAA